jgi:membrane-associated phospholipid phosphatase
LEYILRNIRSSVACVVCVTCLTITAPAFGQEQTPNIFKSTLNDFRNLPSTNNLTWLTIGGAIAATGQMKDWDVTQSFSAARMRGTFDAGETIGGARAQIAGALATYTVGRVIKHKKVTSVGSELIRAQIVAQAMTAGIKLAARRHRPDGGEFSFPSGHTSVTFATATVLQRNFGWKAGIPGYALASYVAASRVNVKRHFFSDVAFGATIGIVAGRTVTIGSGRARFAVSPSASPSHAGLSFTLIGAN